MFKCSKIYDLKFSKRIVTTGISTNVIGKPESRFNKREYF